MRAPQLAILASVTALAACGPVTAGPVPTASPAAHTTSAAPSVTTAPPTPAPLPPLAVLQSDTALTAVDDGGKVQWSLTRAEMNTLLSATAHDAISARVAGPNVILSVVPAASTTKGRLVVLDGTGTSLGASSFTPNNAADDVYGSPSGSEWAYSIDDSPASATRHHGRIIVAGIGTAPHTVFSWVAPAGSVNERVAGWTDMGIVMERISLEGCGVGFHSDSASFLVDPVAGTLTDLFVGGDHYGDARHGVKVAFAARSSSAVVVKGVRFDEGGTVVDSVFVSPDGSRVGVGRVSVVVCAGSPTLTVSTELIDVSTAGHSDITGCEISGWFDAGDFVCSPQDSTSSTPTQRTEDVAGHAGTVLGLGRLAGVLSSA
jgi:hypothetical protein